MDQSSSWETVPLHGADAERTRDGHRAAERAKGSRTSPQPETASPSAGEVTARSGLTPEFREWLRVQRGSAGTTHDAGAEELERQGRLLCQEARRRGAHVEELLVSLKREWAAPAPAVDGDGRGDGPDPASPAFDRVLQARAILLERIVNVLIEEFYRE